MEWLNSQRTGIRQQNNIRTGEKQYGVAKRITGRGFFLFVLCVLPADSNLIHLLYYVVMVRTIFYRILQRLIVRNTRDGRVKGKRRVESLYELFHFEYRCV